MLAGTPTAHEFFQVKWRLVVRKNVIRLPSDRDVYGELLFRQAPWMQHCYIPFLYVIDFKSTFNCGEAHLRSVVAESLLIKHQLRIPYGQKTQTSRNSVTCSFPQAHLGWTSPTEKQRLQFRFHGVVDSGGIQDALDAVGGLRHGNGQSRTPGAKRISWGREADPERSDQVSTAAFGGSAVRQLCI